MRQELQVKGVSRRVVIVPTDDESIFEQVICIVKEDAETVSAETVLREAEEALFCEMEEDPETSFLLRALPLVLLALLVLIAAVLVWCYFFGM